MSAQETAETAKTAGRAATANEIRDFIATEFLAGEDASDLTDDFDIVASGVIDSLGLVRLVSHIATAYRLPLDGMAITPDDFRTIAAITELIDAHSASVAA
jgi:acyl carrier protein